MPIDLGKLAADVAETVVFWKDDNAKVTYRPSAITTKALEKIQASKDDDIDSFVEFLQSIIVDWDIYNGKEKLPVSADSLKRLPVHFLKEIISSIMEDNTPGEAKGHSHNGSAQAASSVSAPIGTPSSEQPNTWA